MALSSREKYIALGVGGAVLFAGLYQLVIDPFLDEAQVISSKRTEITKKLTAAEFLFKKRVELRPVWSSDINKIGGLKNDSSESETQMQEMLAHWAKDAGLELISQRPDEHLSTTVDRKSDKPETKFERNGVHVIGVGTMAHVSDFLWKVESVPKLLRVAEIHITPIKEATDNLQIQLNVNTVSLINDVPPARQTGTARPAETQSNQL